MVLKLFKNDLLTNVLRAVINQTHFYLFIYFDGNRTHS